MDREKLGELRDHLEYVDERFTHRLRHWGGASLVRLGPEELERRQRDLAEYVVELKDVLRQLLQAIDDGGVEDSAG